MTTQEKLTKIESIIREACPELQEPAFGCEFKCTEEIVEGAKGRTGIVISRDFSLVDCAGGHREIDTSMVYYNKDKYFEIIGHPIHLQHILRAMQGDMNRFDAEYAFYIRELILRFDLTLPLHLQSDEFISWLYGVLVGE